MHRRLMSIGTLCLLVLQGNPSAAADSPADLDAYCRAVHGDGAFQEIDRRDNGFLCTIGKDPGPGMNHHKMQPADACATQHNTPTFRREGEKVVCTNIGDAVDGGASETVDLQEYCTSQYGSGAEVTRNNATGASMCTVRTDGGLGLLHNVIDLAALCPSGRSPGVVINNALSCVSSSGASSGQSSGSGGTLDGPGGGSRGGDSETASNEPSGPGQDLVADEAWESADTEIWAFAPGSPVFGSNLVEIRIERLGNRIRGIIENIRGYPYEQNQFSSEEWQQFMGSIDPVYTILASMGLNKAGRVIFEGTVDGNRLHGRQRVLVQGGSVIAPYICLGDYANYLDTTSQPWPSFEGTIEPGRIAFQAPTMMINGDQDVSTGSARLVNCRLEVLGGHIYDVVLVQSPQVVEIKVVGAEPPFEEAGSVAAGQRLRVRLTVDIDSSGQEIKTSIKSGDKSISLLAVCGAPPDENPRICISPVFQLGQNE